MCSYRLENDTFVIENYDKKVPFCSFLPGLTGEKGIPIWSFYVNRGQCVTSFGIDNKHKPIMEFFPANVAYENTAVKGFRTFIRKNGEYFEPFFVNKSKKNASFKFSAFDKVSEMSGAFDPTVTIGDAIVKDIDKVMAAGKNSKVAYVTVSFAYDGKLPGKTEVTLNVSNEGFKEGQTLYLYYFNETTKAFELVDDSKYESGSVVFEMEHCSDYIVTAEKLAGADKNSTPNKTPANSPKTGDVSVLLYSVIFLAGLAIITVCARKNREKQL